MKNVFISAALVLAAAYPLQSNAQSFAFSFNGSGVHGDVVLTYGAATDSKYPQAFEVTGISGTFSDSNNGLDIVNAPIGSLVPITHATPDVDNLLAPHDFSRFAVAAGLSEQNNGTLSFDNLYWPGGSPQTASDYPVKGGYLDIYGLMFNIGGGRVVNFWSNGDFSGTGAGPFDYGVAVATPAMALDYVGGVVVAVPEPSTYALMLAGIGMLGWIARRRQQQ
ncbi:MAG: PEP-CTERM sorting domain-containing protein [Caldimonas sp.]